MTLLRYSLILCLLIAAFFSFHDIYARPLADRDLREFSSLQGDARRARLQSFENSADAAQTKVAAAYYASIGEKSPTQGEKISAWCNALSLYGKALTAEPFDSRTLLNWANIRQLLGNVSCTQPFTKGSFADVASFATAQDPSSVNNRYIAGLLYYWNGDLAQASDAFNFVLRFGVGLDEVRRNQIFSIASTPQRLTSIVPAKAPQAVQYLNWFQAQYVKGERWSEQLSESKELAQFKTLTLKSLSEGIENRSFPFDIMRRWIYELDAVSLTSSERAQLDALFPLLHVHDSDTDILRSLKSRITFAPLAVNLGLINADTRIEKNAITAWGKGLIATFDTYHATVGIFARHEHTPLRIEMHCGEVGTLTAQPGQVQILISDDNLLYKDVTSDVGIEYVQDLEQSFFVLDTERVPVSTNPNGRFWKIHFNSSARHNQCRQPLQRMVRVYGKGEEPDAAEIL